MQCARWIAVRGISPRRIIRIPFDDDETVLAAAIGRIDVVGLSAATAGTVDAGGGFCNTFLALFEALAMKGTGGLVPSFVSDVKVG